MIDPQTIRTDRAEAYRIGDSWLYWVQARRVLAAMPPDPERRLVRRPTRDRWGRCWQAEFDGRLSYLGAARGWTRAGAIRRLYLKARRA